MSPDTAAVGSRLHFTSTVTQPLVPPVYHSSTYILDTVEDFVGAIKDVSVVALLVMVVVVVVVMVDMMVVMFVCWLLNVPATCYSVSQGRICSDNFTCCHTDIEVADQTSYLTQSQYTDTGPASPSADPITPGTWKG